MRKRIFIPIMDIDSKWMLRGFSCNSYAQEYCEQVLNIPAQYIEKTILGEEGIEINLIRLDKIEEQKWYVKLQRLNRYRRVS